MTQKRRRTGLDPGRALDTLRRWATQPGGSLHSLGALNGLFGDRLAQQSSPLAIPMSLHFGPEKKPLVPPYDALAGRAQVCVFVHGLMATDRAWALATKGRAPVDYAELLRARRGIEPVFVRYNSGRHISENGRELADRLESVVAVSPGLRELSVVGHSMGGLVTRSAVHYGTLAGHRWVKLLRRAFLLGSPSQGASAEQVAHLVGFVLKSIWNPWTKALGELVNLRSAGIKDLRFGFVQDEDWQHRDPDTLALRRPRPVVAPPHIRWVVIAGDLWPVVGDGLVTARSAAGLGLGAPAPGVLPGARVVVVPELSHMALMNDPAVLAEIEASWSC